MAMIVTDTTNVLYTVNHQIQTTISCLHDAVNKICQYSGTSFSKFCRKYVGLKDKLCGNSINGIMQVENPEKFKKILNIPFIVIDEDNQIIRNYGPISSCMMIFIVNRIGGMHVVAI